MSSKFFPPKMSLTFSYNTNHVMTFGIIFRGSLLVVLFCNCMILFLVRLVKEFVIRTVL